MRVPDSSSNEKAVFLTQPANPGAAATATIYETTSATTQPKRVRVACYIDAAATFYCKWKPRSGATWRTFNGTGSGESIAATTFFERDVLLMPGLNQITIVTGAGPTVWEVDAELLYSSPLAQ